MPLDVRERLVEAAARAGRSLNSEIVDRLERSLEEESPNAARPSSTRAGKSGSRESLEGRGMSRQRLRLGLVGLAALVLVAVAAIMGGLRGSTTSSGQVAGAEVGEMPNALANHLATLRQAMPGNQGMSEEGPGGAADAAFLERAYPDATISVAEMNGAREAFSDVAGIPYRAGEGDGRWETIGPSRALYPFTEFRNSFNYVPTDYVAGGRTTSIALSDKCSRGRCEAYITPAGGGVWHTDNIFSRGDVDWTYLGGPLGINAAGSVTIDPNDKSGNTVYVGTGEANICGSGCVAGTGMYKSTNGGRTWKLLGKAEFQGKGIGEIIVKPGDKNTIYAATTTALRGMTSVCCTGVTRPVPGIAKWGLYKSTDGGANWSFIHNGATTTGACTGDLTEFNNGGVCSPRGVRSIELDPSNSNTIYASSYARGVWRSTDAGATWTQIKPSLNPAVIQTRPAISVNRLASGKTRMYVYEGNTGAPYSRLFRSDDVASGAPVFADLTSPDPSQPGFGTFNLCTAQCWYDVFVYTPKGHPDVVYAGGSYSYGETIANKRAVVLSTDAGVTSTDMTFDGTDSLHPNGLHPDQHDIAVHPNDPFLFVETNDGGVMRSNGDFVNRSSWCSDPARDLDATEKARCEQMLSRIPERLEGLNDGLNTLQFQSLSISPHNNRIRQGGTQDNGTWQTNGSQRTWENTIIGDGGQSGFDVAIPGFRFHNYTNATPEVNFNNGSTGDWIWVADPVAHGGEFYAPVISDPVVSKTMFAGTSRTAYRTKTHGLGTMTMAEAQEHCNTWNGDFSVQCGDWAELGPTRLVSATWGDRAGGNVAAIERTSDDTGTAWAATTTGRVFVTKNVDAEGVTVGGGANPIRVATNVLWRRIDQPTTPNRFVSSIHVDENNGNRAWVSYSGYSVNTPTTPGHVFEVVFDPTTGTATWTNLGHNLADLPITDLVRDDKTGDLYAATDFGVLRLAAGTTTWRLAARGMPNVEVAGLTVLSGKRELYAASHGLSAWLLDLDELDDGDDEEDDDDDDDDDD
jgi:Arc-like DNA binding domain